MPRPLRRAADCWSLRGRVWVQNPLSSLNLFLPKQQQHIRLIFPEKQAAVYDFIFSETQTGQILTGVSVFGEDLKGVASGRTSDGETFTVGLTAACGRMIWGLVVPGWQAIFESFTALFHC